MQMELKNCDVAYFITLTYDSKNIPLTEFNLDTLDKTDLQKFFKRMRKNRAEKFRYYACGEYGNKTNRPHYHFILFVTTYGYDYSLNMCNYHILKSWGLGLIHVGNVTPASISYVAKYVCTKDDVNDYVVKPFALMSRKPAIGGNFLTPDMVNYQLAQKTLVAISNGVKQPLPRYYKNKIFVDDSTIQDGLKTDGPLNTKKRANEILAKRKVDKKKVDEINRLKLAGEPDNYYLVNQEQSEKRLRNSITKNSKL